MRAIRHFICKRQKQRTLWIKRFIQCGQGAGQAGKWITVLHTGKSTHSYMKIVTAGNACLQRPVEIPWQALPRTNDRGLCLWTHQRIQLKSCTLLRNAYSTSRGAFIWQKGERRVLEDEIDGRRIIVKIYLQSGPLRYAASYRISYAGIHWIQVCQFVLTTVWWYKWSIDRYHSCAECQNVSVRIMQSG